MFEVMSTVERTLRLIRQVHADLGTLEFSRLSGVPYTTLRDLQARNFTGPSIETFQKLADAAEAKAGPRKRSSRRTSQGEAA